MARKKEAKPRLRYGVMYWFDGRKVTDPNAWGSTEKLVNACGNAARHVSRSEFDGREYRRAAVWDRWTGMFVRIYSTTADGISILRYDRNGHKIEKTVTTNVVPLKARA